MDRGQPKRVRVKLHVKNQRVWERLPDTTEEVRA